MAKTKTIKAKVTKARRDERALAKSKGAEYPWQVYGVGVQGHYCMFARFESRKLAVHFLKQHPELVAPVIIHIDIPPMEY